MTVRITATLEKVEIITSVYRRRRRSTAETMRMVDETPEPCASVRQVACSHDVNSNQHFA